MLVLTRMIGEKILIGDDIEIEIVDMTRNYVRVGITAPKEIRILRGEIVNGQKEAVCEGAVPGH